MEADAIEKTNGPEIFDELGARLLEGIEVCVAIAPCRGQGDEEGADGGVEVVGVGESPLKRPELWVGQEGHVA